MPAALIFAFTAVIASVFAALRLWRRARARLSAAIVTQARSGAFRTDPSPGRRDDGHGRNLGLRTLLCGNRRRRQPRRCGKGTCTIEHDPILSLLTFQTTATRNPIAYE